MTLRRSGLPFRRPPATGLLGHYPDRTLTGKPIAAWQDTPSPSAYTPGLCPTITDRATATGTHVPGLRLADRRSHALLQALLVFRCQPSGFANKDLHALTGKTRGLDPDAVTTGQTIYDLRRLKHRGLITTVPDTHRYQVTDHGHDTAKFLTTVHGRILPTGLADLAATGPASGPLKAAATAYHKAVDTLTTTTQFAA